MRWSVGRKGFNGMRLRRDSRFTGLPLSVVDANLIHGDLRPFPCPIEKCDLGDVEIATIAEVDECPCLTFDEHTCYFEDCGLYFWNDESGIPRISTPEQFCIGEGCTYGVQCPSAPPTIDSFETAPSTSNLAECDSHFFAYRYSYIVEIGGREFEGHWSPPSGCSNASADPQTILSGIEDPGGCHTKIRIYQAASGNHNGESLDAEELGGWFPVGTYPIGGTYQVTAKYCDLQRPDPISPDEYNSPPENIRSLGITDNGVAFGLEDQCLVYTLPCRPMTWSARRKICIPKRAGKPIKAVARGEDVYVYTDKKPVFLKGVISDSGIGFDLTVINKFLPLVSIGSITSGYAGEYYASTDGYYLWNQAQIDNVTNDWFGRDNWCQQDPESINGAIIEDYLVWSTSVDAFMLTFGDRLSQTQEGSNTLVGLDMNGTMIGATAHKMNCDGKLEFANNGKVYCWDLCSDVTISHHKEQIENHETCCPWRICEVIDVDQKQNMSRGEIKFDLSTLKNGIDLKYYQVVCCEKELLKELNIKDCSPFTLPGCSVAEDFMFEAMGCERVKHFSFASSLFELSDNPIPRENYGS